MILSNFFDFSIGPKVVAEISANHDGSLAQALELVHAAAESGVHAIKLQTFSPESMTLDSNNPDFVIQDEQSIWNGYRLFDLYKKAQTPREWHEEIFSLAKSLNIVAFSSAFDSSSVDFLESIDSPCYKIASFESIDTNLIKRVAQTRKPVIISTGMANVSEIFEAVNTAKEYGCEKLVLLKCTSSYPALTQDTNLKAIPLMKNLFELPVGLSDHTLGIGAAIASVAFGAVMIEKHIKIDDQSKSLDAKFSLTPNQFKVLVEETQRAFEALGSSTIGPTNSELNARGRRRSLYFSKSLKSGEIITPEKIQSVRPGKGLEPRYLDIVIGMRVTRDIEAGETVNWEIFK